MKKTPVTLNVPSQEDRNWAMLCHLSGLLGSFAPFLNVLVPLAIWLWKADAMPYVREQGKEAVNFQITILLLVIVASALTVVFIGIPLLYLLAVINFILVIVAVVKVKEGEDYEYPFAWRLIR